MITETTEDVELFDQTEDTDIGQGEIQFIPTGVKHKDMAIAGMINDATNACKALIKAKVWDKVCASPNPAGAADLEILRIADGTIPNDKMRLVLIKLKTLLAGVNMTIPQAFHKCVLNDHIKRINLDKIIVPIIRTDITPQKPQIETKDVETPQLNGSVLTHPDGSTYTFGNRGRRPSWVQEWLKTHDEP